MPKTELAKDMARDFDPITLREIAKGAESCAVMLNKKALEAANNGQNDLAIDYMRDSDFFENLSKNLTKLVQTK